MYHVAMQQLLPHVIRTCSNWKGSRKKGLGLRYVKLYKDCNTWIKPCKISLIGVIRLWYLWLFFSVCGRASPCYSCKDFITFRRTCIHSRGYDTLYWQEKTYCAVPKWVVLASSETRLGANRIVADCFQTYPWSSEFLEQWKWYLPCRGTPWYRCTLWPVATLSSVCQAGARVGDLPP